MVPWGQQDLVLQEDLFHLFIHVYPLGPWGDSAALAGLAGLGISGIPGIPAAQREVYLQDLEPFFTFWLGMLWTTKYCKENPSFFLELQSNSSLRTFCYGYLFSSSKHNKMNVCMCVGIYVCMYVCTDINADNGASCFAQSTDFHNAVTSLSTACCDYRPFLFEGKKWPLVDGCVDVSSRRY